MTPEEWKAAVVRLTAPGLPENADGPEPAVISEWRGIAHVKPEPAWDRPEPYPLDGGIYFPEPYITGVTVGLDMSNASVKRLDQQATLNDIVGLEVWTPTLKEGGAVWLDPLAPRDDWDTSTGTWVRVRYHFGRVAQYTHQSFIKEMMVNVFRGPGVNELYRMEVMGW